MSTTALVVVAVAAFVAWGLIQIGIWIGGSKTSRYRVKGFIRDLDLKSDSEEIKEINQSLGPWYSIRGNGETSAIGEALAKAGRSEGVGEFQRAYGPKPGEAEVTMDKQELSSIAWLADYGLRAWTTRSNNEVRGHHDRLPKERAQILSDLLDTFERRAANWPSETEDEREMRFGNYEDRMKRMWENYG